MALTQSHFQEYDFDRMVVRFTMKNDQASVACAISTDAMDQLEGSSRTPPDQREQQFMRLRDRIEERAARKFSDVELEGNPPGVILRAIDFREARK
jgi:phage shock protein A